MADLQCIDERRKTLVRHSRSNGIDYLEVVDLDYRDLALVVGGAAGELLHGLRQRTLLVRFLKPLPDPAADPAAALSAARVRVFSTTGGKSVAVEWAMRATEAAQPDPRLIDEERGYLSTLPRPDEVLVVRTAVAGDHAPHALRLVGEASGNVWLAPEGFDRVLAEVGFSFKVECPSELDCRPPARTAPPPPPAPQLSYLVKDYASFRRAMLDRLSLSMPGWRERSPAGLVTTLVELLAYVGDHLSYYQDAAATEAYLGTARRRTSVRRHARLLDYRLHEGCSARLVAVLEVGSAIELPRATALLTRGPAGVDPLARPKTVVPPSALAQVVREGAEVFETLHCARLRPQRNAIEFYTWQRDTCHLPAGATRATLIGSPADLDLTPGDLLVIAHEIGVEAWEHHPGPTHGAFDGIGHHVVRVTAVSDPLSDEIRFADSSPDVSEALVEIEWHAADALPFALCVRRDGRRVAWTYGNVVVADHGRTVVEQDDPAGSGFGTGRWRVRDDAAFRPELGERRVAHTQPYADAADGGSAADLLDLDPRKAQPAVVLHDDGQHEWRGRADLLASGRFDRHFVVEADELGAAWLRFGDGVLGRQPSTGTSFRATYRVGGGPAGNVGAGSVTRVATDASEITRVFNPLPASGGTAPEPMAEARLYAPQAFREPSRAVTPVDYERMAARHDEVQRAAATRRWTGSWYTMFVSADRRGGRNVDDPFEQRLRAHLEPYRLAGHDLEVDDPQPVALRIHLCVCVEPSVFAGDVARELVDVFGTGVLADGRKAFFHPDHFTFHQPLYLSDVIGAAMAVPGVRWVEAAQFRRLLSPELVAATSCCAGDGDPGPTDPLVTGVLPCGRLEILRCDSDPAAPGNGAITFCVEGGL